MEQNLTLKIAGKTDVGKRRNNNQDSMLINESLKLFAVADGMGGHSGGEVASALAVKTLEKVFLESRGGDVGSILESAIQLSNKVIFEQSQSTAELQGMGTTLTAAVLEGNNLHIGQVGDSRLYLFRDGELYQITEDHSQVYELIKAGLVTEANIHTVQRNIITRSVGYEKSVVVDMFIRKVLKGDRYLLCSDGLSGMIGSEQIAQILSNHDVEKSVDNLIELANLNGGEDNITAILLELT